MSNQSPCTTVDVWSSLHLQYNIQVTPRISTKISTRLIYQRCTQFIIITPLSSFILLRQESAALTIYDYWRK